MNHSTESILSQRHILEDLGYHTLPLRGKLPYQKGWTKRTPASLWRTAGQWDNIGIRAGGALGVTVIDADEKNAVGTVTSIERFLTGLGLNRGDYPLTMTPSGGTHSYLKLVGERLPGSYRSLGDGLAGEFRYGSGSQSVAPPSAIDAGRYLLVAGNWATLPSVTVSQLLPLLTANESTHSTPLLDYSDLPFSLDADLLLQTALRHAQPGTRHNVLLGLVRRLRDAGHSQDSATALALAYQEHVTQRVSPFTEAEALSIVTYLYSGIRSGDTAGVAKALQALEFAALRDWPGRTRHTDRIVFEAHAMIAMAANVSQWHAPVRRLAEMGNMGQMTAYRANKRLQGAGLIAITNPSERTNANEFCFGDTLLDNKNGQNDTYRVDGVKGEERDVAGRRRRGGETFVVPELAEPTAVVASDTQKQHPICITLSDNDALLADVFSFGGLGRSAMLVWIALGEDKKTTPELAKLAKVSCRTCRRVLAVMAKHDVVSKSGKRWKRTETPLEDVAEALGVRGTASRREALHSEHSQEWAELVAINEHNYRPHKMEDAKLARETKYLTDAKTRTERVMDSEDQYITPDGRIEAIV